MIDSLLTFLQTDAGSNLVLGAIALLISIIVKLGFVKKHKLGRCMLAFQSGVQEVYQNYVKGLKEANADGKLTDLEKSEAVDMAYRNAKTILEEEGIALAKYYKPRISKSIIDAIVKRSKTAGRMAKGLLEIPGGE